MMVGTSKLSSDFKIRRNPLSQRHIHRTIYFPHTMYNSSIQDTTFPTLQVNENIRSWQQKFFLQIKKK
jgi:hypothetical protein